MKKIYSIKDDSGGYIEVNLLKRNNIQPLDLIWLHLKSDDEFGFCMTSGEATIIAEGLLSAVNKLKTYDLPTNKDKIK